MIQIEVSGSEVREVVKKATGEVFRITEVNAYAHHIDKYPVAIKFSVGKGQTAPEPGMYELLPESFFAGKFGQLSLRGQLALKPAANQKPRAA